MTLSRVQGIFSHNIARLIIWWTNQGGYVSFGEGYRPRAMQYLYYHGKDIDPVTGELIQAQKRSWTMTSLHMDRLAHDLNFFNNKGELLETKEELKAIGEYWKSLQVGNVWGGEWKTYDGPHFEMNPK
jgi:hypothetical protein